MSHLLMERPPSLQPDVSPCSREEAPQHFAVAWKAIRGPRPELQDLPFAIRLWWVEDGYTLEPPVAPREESSWRRDLLVAGILDGVGGTYMPIDLDRVPDLEPFLRQRGLITSDYCGRPGTFLTGRAAALFLRDAIARRAVDLSPEPELGYGLVQLLRGVNRDLYRLNQHMVEHGATTEEPRHKIGAAVSISAVDRDGGVRYANAGDCRAGIVRMALGGKVDELSVKQTLAAAVNTRDMTTIGHAGDNRLLSALGFMPELMPAAASSSMDADDFLVHLSDGAREAMMHAPALADLPWNERTLASTCERTLMSHLSGAMRTFPAMHMAFDQCVRPYVADDRTRTRAGKVFDNASMLLLRRTDAIAATMDHVYEAIEEGRVSIARSPFAIGRRELTTLAEEVGLAPPSLALLEQRIEQRGLRISDSIH